MMRPGRTGLLLATVLSAFALTACGSATVENDPGTDTSVAPLERAPQSTSENNEDDREEEGGDRDSQSAAQPQPQDQRAQEVSEVPSPEPERSEEDTDFLDGVAEGGIDIEGVEDQLIGAASTVCRPADQGEGEGAAVAEVTVGAVAGQLQEQGRTELDQEDAAALIENEARAAYC